MTFTVSVDGRELAVVLGETLDDRRALRGHWKEFTSASTSQSGFLTWEWLYAWSERFIRSERRLFVLIASEGPALLGIAPWYIHKTSHGAVSVREIGFLGLPEGGSDYFDVVAKVGMERVVAEALYSVLFGQCSSCWDVLRLREILSESAFLVHFISQFQQNGKHYEIEEGSFCPGVQLPDSFEKYLGQLSSHRRHAHKREMKILLADDGVEHVVRRGEKEVRPLLPVFRELYEKRWDRNEDDLVALLVGYLPRAQDA